MVLSAAVFLAAITTACATPTYDYQPISREISEPPLNAISVAAVGDSMVRQGKYIEHDGIRLSEKLSVGLMGSYTFMPGEYSKTGQNKSGEFFLPTNGAGSGRVNASPIADPFQSIMLGSDGQICGVSVLGAYVCTKATGVEKVKLQGIAADAFQQTLIYSGKVGDKINVGYREFSSNVARPAFNNDVEYDLKDSTTIGYKGALIEVLEATNQSIRYRVIQNFNRAE
ncbi:MAG: hypothetical protein EON93_02425 [Burkholderiales bacterium]|nr:MAG: hypothetical protein EON93_02425 [Burkholderiales bacterium]